MNPPVSAKPRTMIDQYFWIVLGMLLLAMLGMHLNSQRIAHTEGDEVVLLFLAERLSEQPLSYNVQGELEGEAMWRFVRDAVQPTTTRPLLYLQSFALIWSPPDSTGARRPMFEPAIYDRPLFFHPPLYPYSLMVVRTILGPKGGIFLSTLFHALTVLFVALLGRTLASSTVGLMAAGLMAVEAVSWTCAERLWIDGMLQMMVTAAALMAVWSARHGGHWRFMLAGACLGLAGLTKLPAGLLAPAVLVVWFTGPRRPRWTEMFGYVAACIILIAPWLIISKMHYGSYLPSDTPTGWMLDRFPWVRMIVNRPSWFYVVGLLLVSPIFLYVGPAIARLRWERWLWFPTVWAASFFTGLTLIGASGMGFQLRYLAPALPALCLLAAAGVEGFSWRWRVPVLAFAAYTLYMGISTGLTAGHVDPIPDGLAQFIANITHWDFRKAIPGVWKP